MPKEPYRVIELTQGYVAVISTEDFRRVNRHSWSVHRSAGSNRSLGRPYARANINGKKVYLHRFIMDAAMDRLQWLDNRLGTWPRQDDWTSVMSVMRNAMRTITSIKNKTIYITAHSQYKQDETTSKMMNEINMVGSLKVKLPLLFSDIWQFNAETKGTDTQFRIQTKPDRYSPYVRCSTQGLDLYEDVTIPKDGWENPEQHGLGKLLKTHKE